MHPRATISTLLALVLSSLWVSDPAARPVPAGPSGRAPIFGTTVVGSVQRIDGNQVSMVVTNQGSIAWDQSSGAAGFEYPKGSGKTAIFAAGPWLGAMVNGQVRMAVSEYSDEYRPGAIVGGLPDDPHRWEYKVYKLQRSYADPAVRDAVLADYNAGAVPFGAPLVLVNGDGTLNIAGDQMLWCVFNDADPTYHQNSMGATAPLGVEVQLTAFAFDGPAPGGPADRTVFLRYRFLNKGANVLEQLHLGMWVDPDLGGFSDDLVGCDVPRGMGYVYNAAGVDQQYGGAPPAVGFDLVAGPTGAGGQPLGLTSFSLYVNGGGPSGAAQTYNILRGLQPSGAPVIDPVSGNPTTFMVTGDPVAGTGWLDSPPSDRRMLLGSGPVTLAPGQSQEMTYAIVVGQGDNRLSSILALDCGDDAIQALHDRAYAPPLPAETDCGNVVNCPQSAFYWFEQLNGGDDWTPAQLTQIAQRVDAASLYWDGGADPVASLRAALDHGSAATQEQLALREYLALLCNVVVSDPILVPGGKAYLDPATPVSCTGIPGQSIAEMARTATHGLSDAYYLDNGPLPVGLVGVPVGLPLWDGAAGYAADLFGSSIPSGSANTHSVEFRFTGGPTGQYAYRYLRTLDGGGNRVYLIQDYVPVPFTVWDVDANVQLNAAFLENAGPPAAPNMNGLWDPDDSSQGGREILWAMDSPYSGDSTPDANYFNDPNLTDMLAGNVDLRYVLWPRQPEPGAAIDPGDLFRFTYGGIVPGPGVDTKLSQLALMPPDTAQALGYDQIRTCVGDWNAGRGVGETCDRPTPTTIALVGVEATSDRVALTWHAGGDPISQVQVERHEPEDSWTTLASVTADGRGMLEYVDTDVVPGRFYAYRLRLMGTNGFFFAGDASVRVPLQAMLSLAGFQVLSVRSFQVGFSLASGAPAKLSLFDVAGRRVFSREVGALGAGSHVVTLDRGDELASGVYVLRLEQDGRSVTRRAVAIH